MSRRYIQAHDGDQVTIPKNTKGWFVIKVMCCDCGLVHKHAYYIKNGAMKMLSWRDQRATSATRRQRKRKNPAASR